MFSNPTGTPPHLGKRLIALAVVVPLTLTSAAPAQIPISNVQLLPSVMVQPSAAEPLAPGEPVPSFTLADLESIALANNPSLGRAASLVQAARGNWLQVGLPLNPSVGYDGQQLGSGGRAEQHGIVAGQEFMAPGKLRLNRAVAAQDVTRAEQALAAQRQRVLTDTRVAYYEVLLAQLRMEVTSQLVAIGSEGVKAADAIFQAKEGSRVDILQAEVEVENAEILAQNARNRHAAAWLSLAAVVGAPDMPPQRLVGDAFAPAKKLDITETLQRLWTASPEIGAAAANIERARFALARARVEPRPNVNLQGLVNVLDNGIDGDPDGAVAVSVPIPLFNRNQGEVIRAQHELAAAQQALWQLELDLQNRLAPVFERYVNARNQVSRFRERILPRTLESLELTRNLYAAGEINYVNLLTVQRTYTQTNLSYMDSLLELRIAETEIDGLLLSGSLQAPNP
jgi:cobalt-zinc-cadmium efflux system outer membrane protein